MTIRGVVRMARVCAGIGAIAVVAAWSGAGERDRFSGVYEGAAPIVTVSRPIDARTGNAIVMENALSGNPASEWDVVGAGDPTIQGFATRMSVDGGETIGFKVDTDAADYRIDIYRVGYYAGLGARKVDTVLPSVTLPQSQPACATDAGTGLVDCGTWAESAHWDVPASAVSGVYIARLVRTDTDGASHIVFVVRDDDSGSDLLFQTSDTTWQAYNRYGGNSLYFGSPAGRAYKVSYNRPFTTRETEDEDWVFNAEYPMIRFLEANGFDVSYCAGIDTATSPAELLEHGVFLSVGHDEYWSADQRANVEAARDAGMHLAFFSGNECFWKTRWESSIDGSATPGRTLVCYKETHANAKIDPVPNVWTGTWRDARFSPPADGGNPENGLTGTIFRVNCCGYAMEVPSEHGALRFWRDTGIDALGPGQVATLSADTVGYEWDEAPDDEWAPAGLVRMSRTSVVASQVITDNGSTYAAGPATHALTLHRAASGALVFGAGTIQWTWGLDGNHDGTASTPDVRMQQATVNLLADMGAFPETLIGGLVAATQTTDSTPPSAAIDAPTPGEIGITVGVPYVISGTAADGEGVVGAVEVSTDDGATWRAAAGRESWTYQWIPASAGPAQIRVRATDDSANLGAQSAAVPVSVSDFEGCEVSVWTDASAPAQANETDGQPIELGVKVRADQDGWITGVRFYKGTLNTGTHIGRVWSSTGDLLGEATFTNETASGWQRANLPDPVPVVAGTTYVASYFSPTGYYGFTQGGLGSGAVHGPIRALAGGEDGANGVYLYSPTGGFPTDSFQSSDYWVDAVFDACEAPPAQTAFTLFDATPSVGTDPNDPGAVELGVKFRCDEAAEVTALRFYKHAQNTGTHVGSLWEADGTLVARVTFAGETASGWQEQALDAPVAIDAGVTYVASYHTTTGHYAFAGGFFATDFVNGPLTAPASATVGGNGVYVYGPSPAFPTDSFNASNYWVDVVVETDPGPDVTAPTVTQVSPGDGATGVAVGAAVSAVFSERMDPLTMDSMSVLVHDDTNSANVTGVVSYSVATRTATFTPDAVLAYSTQYTATVVGAPDANAVTDLAGNALGADAAWTFTTAAPPPPPPDEGPGGPILIVTSTTNPFGRYYAEILRAEGLNAFEATDVSLVTPAVLAAHNLVILAEFALTPPQASMLEDWVDAGGRLIAMRPDALLYELVGVQSAGSGAGDAYYAIDTGALPGAGIVAETMQYHGTASRWSLDDATPIATLYSDAATATSNPAATMRDVGANGGRVAAFAFDVARSVVYTRQGNPAWAGQERDGMPPLRSDDMFYGDAPFDPQPDWVDLDKVAIPQADELQRFLANVIHVMTIDRTPMPRFWYLPRGLKAAIVMTGDDHANNGTEPRFTQYLALSDPGCSLEDWECIRGSSYIYLNTPISDAVVGQFESEGFEIGVHPFPSCGWSVSEYATGLAAELAQFAVNWPSAPAPLTSRTHCIAWSDWATQPVVEAMHGIRMDTNYYYWPPGWVQDRPGVFTGSALPMRFADTDGTMIDCYQLATQMTDESGQSYPLHADTLLDRALGPMGFYGAYCANMHTDSPTSSGSDAIIASAQARGVPVITARQMLEWTDGRNGSSFGGLEWDGATLSFDIALGSGSRNIEAMAPWATAAGEVQSITGPGGGNVAFTMRTVKGVDYAVFRPSTPGVHAVFYATPAPCVGDVNGDGFTNSADFNVLAGHFGQSVTPGTNGDLNSDGFVSSADFNILAGDFGCGVN